MSSSAGNYRGDEPELLNSLRAHKTAVNSVVFSPDSSKLVSGSDDGNVVFWNLIGSKPQETGLCYRLTGHKDAINCVDYSSRGDFFVSASMDTTVRLWKLNAACNKPNEEAIVYKCHSVNVRHVNLNPASTHFCTSSDDKTVKVWDAQFRNKFITSLLGHTNWVRCSKFCPTRPDLVASCGDDCQILVHDTRSPTRAPPVQAISGSKGKHHSYSHFTTLDWFPLSDFLIAVGSSDASLRVYDLRQGQIVQYYEAHNGPISSIQFHKSGNYLISGSTDNLLKVYDLLEGRVLFTIRAHTGPVKCVRLSKNGETFASSGNDRTIYLWKSNLAKADEVPTASTAPSGCGNFNLNASMSPLKVHNRETIPKSAGAHFSSHRSSRSSLASEPPLNHHCNRSSESSHIRRYSSAGASLGSSAEHLRTRSPSFEEAEIASPDYHPSERNRSSYGGRRSNLTVPDNTHAKESPEQNLLQGIVSQISNLTDAITLLEKRLSVVENLVQEGLDPAS